MPNSFSIGKKEQWFGVCVTLTMLTDGVDLKGAKLPPLV
jgi:hypothetical protein